MSNITYKLKKINKTGERNKRGSADRETEVIFFLKNYDKKVTRI